MGQKIWSVLADYAGRWVAVDNDGEVVAQASTLTELRGAVGENGRRLTVLFASAR